MYINVAHARLAAARRAGLFAQASSFRPALRAAAKRHSQRRAFTLIELMISVALVLVLILGVNQIFKYTTDAVGRGQAITDTIANSRALQAVFDNDFAGLVKPGSGPTDACCLILSSRARYGFLSAADYASQGPHAPGNNFQAVYGVPASDNNDVPNLEAAYRDMNGAGTVGDSTVPGDITQPFQYNPRNHRLDVLSFFARGLFRRQTGNPGTFVDNMASSEAWIWYGHGWLPDNSGAWGTSGIGANHSPSTFPCEGTHATNPNNYFANQLVLCRRAILLTPTIGGGIYDNSKAPQWFNDTYSHSPDTPYYAAQNKLSPLAADSPLNKPNGSPSDPLSNPSPQNIARESRVDVANTSISQFQQSFLTLADAANGYKNYNVPSNWVQSLLNGEADGRFQCNPYVGKPMSSMDMAHAAPYMMGGCSQFIVEYAGDYLTQDNNSNSSTYGFIQTAGPDGQVDYRLVTDPNNILPPRKQIIWYGLPRYTSGATTGIDVRNGDVAPLSYWLAAILPNYYKYDPQNGAFTSFEKRLPQFKGGGLGTQGLSSMLVNSQYVCAFATADTVAAPNPNTSSNAPPYIYVPVSAPKLIRITLTLEDPTGRLPDGQTYQYVFQLP